MPLSSHSCLPSSEYERTLSVPAVTISVRSACSHTNGVDQLLASSRSTRQISWPVRESQAATHELVSLSFTTEIRPLWGSGEAALPCPFRVVSGDIAFDR